MEKKMVSLRLDEGLLQWATAYAESRGVSRTELLESALASFKVDCDSGVPELKRRIADRDAPRDGECSCPLVPGPRESDGMIRGLSTSCPVHGRSRRDFQQATADRAVLFQGIRPPLSVRGGAKPKGEK